MPLFPIAAELALSRLDEFDTVIDARSEGEYAHDHLPGAVNWPTLHDEQRREIGTLYKQVHPFEAKKRGAAMAARNIAAHLEREALNKPKHWKPLVYCWRGGKRSGALGLVLSEIGFRVELIEGGYKAFRHALLADLQQRTQRLHWRVLCGTTGTGKTRLLQALTQCGAQVLDLEALAQHRSSVLGAIPELPQPSQKAFDTRIWNALRRFDATRPVFVESESRKIGNLALTDALLQAMHAAPCLRLVLSDEQRVALLLEGYAHYLQQQESFCERLDTLSELRGKKVVQAWKDAVRTGRIAAVVRELLLDHYDPAYRQSMARNFKHYAQAPELHLADRSAQAMQAVVAQILSNRSCEPPGR